MMIRFSVVSLAILSLLFILSCTSAPKQTLLKDINDKYQVKISSFRVRSIILDRELLTFESINTEKNSQQNIFSNEHDDPQNLEEIPINVINENLSYLWFCYNLAVTENGGNNWNVWNVSEFENDNNINLSCIKDVSIDETGIGKIFFHTRTEMPYLITNDFGKTWQKP